MRCGLRLPLRVLEFALVLALVLPNSPARAQDEPLPAAGTATTALDLLTATSTIGGTLTATTTETSTTTKLSEEGVELLGVRPDDPSLLPYVSSSTRTLAGPAEPEFRIPLFYTGASAGIGVEHYRFDMAWHLEDALQPHGHVKNASVVHGIFVQGTETLIAPDFKVRSLSAFIQGGGIICGDPEPALSVRTPRERLLIRTSQDSAGFEPDWVAAIRSLSPNPPRKYDARVCRNAHGRVAHLYSPAASAERFEPPTWSLRKFEVRQGLHVEFQDRSGTHQLEIVGIPGDEAARRFHLLQSRTVGDASLYVDSGSFVDGGSRFQDGELSGHRRLDFEMLSRLKPNALAPGRTELLPGPSRFLAEAKAAHLNYVATNWVSEDGKNPLPKSIITEVHSPDGPVRVAFLAALDPAMVDWAPKIKDENVKLVEPVAAIMEEVRRLNHASDRPDVVVVLTTADGNITTDLRERLRGVDLILGDSTTLSERETRATLDLAPDEASPDRHVAAVLPLQSLSQADLLLRRTPSGVWFLRAVEVSHERISEQLMPDARVVEVLTLSRSRTYPPLDRPLIAAKPGAPLEALTDAEWRHAVCEAVLRATQADVVFLPELPPITRLPGPITGIVASSRLSVLDRVTVDSVSGDQLIPMLRDALQIVPTACGFQIGKAKPNVLGRPIRENGVYRVVTTDRALLRGLDELFHKAHPDRWLEGSGPEPLLGRGGEPITLRRLVLGELHEMKAAVADAPAPLEPLLADSAATPRPTWYLLIDRLDFDIERFQGANDMAFAKVPETLATSPSSLTVGLEGNAALAYDSADLLGEFRVTARFHRISLPHGVVQQVDDNLRLSSSVSLPGAGFPTGPLKWMPYSELRFDTQFLPPVTDGVEAPRAADLSLTLGLSTGSAFVSRLRLGAFAQRDLARVERRTDYGARLEAELGIDLGHGLRWSNSIDGSYFADTRSDDETDLRFRALVESRLALPLAKAFHIATFVRGFTFEGRIPETEHVRLALLFGFSLEIREAFRL